MESGSGGTVEGTIDAVEGREEWGVDPGVAGKVQPNPHQCRSKSGEEGLDANYCGHPSWSGQEEKRIGEKGRKKRQKCPCRSKTAKSDK